MTAEQVLTLGERAIHAQQSQQNQYPPSKKKEMM